MTETWQNVESAMPELETPVLVFIPDCKRQIRIAIYKMDSFGDFVWMDITEGYCFDAEKITHWMPLPQGPRT